MKKVRIIDSNDNSSFAGFNGILRTPSSTGERRVLTPQRTTIRLCFLGQPTHSRRSSARSRRKLTQGLLRTVLNRAFFLDALLKYYSPLNRLQFPKCHIIFQRTSSTAIRIGSTLRKNRLPHLIRHKEEYPKIGILIHYTVKDCRTKLKNRIHRRS